MARTHSGRPQTWVEVKQFAYGELGLHPWEFGEYTFEELVFKIRGYDKTKQEKMFNLRALCWTVYQSGGHAKKGITIERFWPLPGDANFVKGSIASLPPHERLAAAKERMERMEQRFAQVTEGIKSGRIVLRKLGDKNLN